MVFCCSFINVCQYAVYELCCSAGKAAIRFHHTFMDCADSMFVKSGAQDWILQFAYGFYSLMLTSTMLGILTMLVYKPRTCCVYCPMGTMTQMVCRVKKRKF